MARVWEDFAVDGNGQLECLRENVQNTQIK